MNEITPPKLIPFDHKRLASGMFAQEQTHESMPTIGPTAAFSIKRNQFGPVSTKRARHQLVGTTAAKNPATRKPATSSFQIIRQSITKALASLASRSALSDSCSSWQQWPMLSCTA